MASEESSTEVVPPTPGQGRGQAARHMEDPGGCSWKTARPRVGTWGEAVGSR